jgi:hypothetical protein
MLDKIAKLDAAVVKALLVAIVGLIGSILGALGVNEDAFGTRAAVIVEALSNVLIAFGVFWGLYARINLPTPPVSDAAVAKTRELMQQKNQGGFISSAVLGLLLIFGAVAVSLTLTGCETLGLQQAKTFEDRWAYAQSQTTGIRETSTRALDAKLIDSGDMEYVIGVADRSSDLLRLARTARAAGDTSTAEGRLQLATAILSELESYLQQRSANRG